MPPTLPTPPRLHALPLWLALVALQWLLVANPGYFSHDELQWGARADVASWGELPWVAWTDASAFQWRPLTFNLWLAVSRALFETPQAMHLAWVGMGSAVAVALGGLLLRLGAAAGPARGAALVFALGPYAAYVHGWVATLGDLLWLGLALALAHAWLGGRGRGWRAPAFVALGFGLTALALLAKEAALAIPAVLVLGWVLRPGERTVAWTALGSGVAGAVYLALRLDVLLAPDPSHAYALSPFSAPRHWLAYWLFPLRPTTFEIVGLWNASAAQLAVTGALLLGMVLMIARRTPRLALALVIGGTLALAPALPLGMAANQYGYGFWAWCVACLALAWPALGRPGRALLLFLALVSTWHGVNVQRAMREAGQLQAVFQPALVAALAAKPDGVRLRAPAGNGWLFRRLSHEVQAWRGEAIGDRVAWVGGGESADYQVTEEGRLAPP